MRRSLGRTTALSVSTEQAVENNSQRHERRNALAVGCRQHLQLDRAAHRDQADRCDQLRATQPVRILRRLRIAAHAQRLDDELAAGASPAFSDELTERAEQLLARRADVAQGLRRAAAGGSRSFPVISAAWLDAKPALLALADDLVDFTDPAPRGVAMATQLLADPGGPLYQPGEQGGLLAAAEAARNAL